MGKGRQVRPDMQQDDPRLDPRSNVFLTAVLCAERGACAVRIRNLSMHGALLEGNDLPPEGTLVEIKRGSLRAAGDIAWSRDQHCGVRVAATIDVGNWLERAGPIGQQRIDSAIADFRRAPTSSPSFAVLPLEMKEARLCGLAAEILQVCEKMAGSPSLTIAVAEQILKIEAAARAIAASPR